MHDDAILRWSDPQKRNAEELDNISIYYLLQTKAPARSAGYVVLVQESLNMSVEARRAWTYSPGTRRVRRCVRDARWNHCANLAPPGWIHRIAASV